MRMPKIIACVALAVLCLVHASGAGLAVDPDPQQVLAPTGRLRAGLYPGTPTSILPNAQGEPRGVGYELGKELARRLGVPYEPVVFSKNAEVLAAVKSGGVDVAFTNASASRAQEMDFGPAYLEIELGYLVPKASAIAVIPEIDVAGRHIGVTEGSTSDATLSRDLKQAAVVHAATITVAIEMLSAGKMDAFATNKATLFEMSEKLPGSKVLDGRWGVERHAIAIPKGREPGLPFLRTFTEEVKRAGLITEAVGRAGLRGAMAAQ
jgi:polar amino acid transport system substrate-binding protein